MAEDEPHLDYPGSVPDTTPADHDEPQTGKGRPTPSRKDREAANKRPLVPSDRKLARQRERASAKANRDREYQAMQTGDERNMPMRDRGPEKRWTRDYVDARRNIGEYFLPFAFLALLAMPFAQSNGALYLSIVGVAYLGLLAGIVDAIILARKVLAGVTEKFGAERVPRGIRMYAVSRALQLRRLRLPRPQVARGEYPS